MGPVLDSHAVTVRVGTHTPLSYIAQGQGLSLSPAITHQYAAGAGPLYGSMRWGDVVCRIVNRDPMTTYSSNTMVSSEGLIFRGRPLSYSMNPAFLNLFKKKFTRERVVPTISASVACEIRGTNGSGVSCWP
jgi:hypothetical protein